MMPDVGERLPKVGELGSLLKTLTPRQLDFVRARLECESDAGAARTAGIHPKLVAKWKAAGAPLDAIIQLAKLDSVDVAVEQLRSDDRLARASADLDLTTSTIGQETSIAGLPCWLEEQDAHPASTTM